MLPIPTFYGEPETTIEITQSHICCFGQARRWKDLKKNIRKIPAFPGFRCSFRDSQAISGNFRGFSGSKMRKKYLKHFKKIYTNRKKTNMEGLKMMGLGKGNSLTHLKFNIAPENGWWEGNFPIGFRSLFRGKLAVKLPGCKKMAIFGYQFVRFPGAAPIEHSHAWNHGITQSIQCLAFKGPMGWDAVFRVHMCLPLGGSSQLVSG